MSRFHEVRTKDDLHFDYDVYDAVRLDDNRIALITDFGIYDNQYWCEVCYPDGVHLGAADYFSSNPEFKCSQIIEKLSNSKKQHIIEEYIKALNKYPELYQNHINEMFLLIA